MWSRWRPGQARGQLAARDLISFGSLTSSLSSFNCCIHTKRTVSFRRTQRLCCDFLRRVISFINAARITIIIAPQITEYDVQSKESIIIAYILDSLGFRHVMQWRIMRFFLDLQTNLTALYQKAIRTRQARLSLEIAWMIWSSPALKWNSIVCQNIEMQTIRASLPGCVAWKASGWACHQVVVSFFIYAK